MLVNYRRVPTNEPTNGVNGHNGSGYANGSGNGNGAGLPEALSCDADTWEDDNWDDGEEEIVIHRM